MCGGLRRLCRRSPAGVSPVRTAVRISTSGRPSAAQLGADAGERRFEVECGCRSTAPSAARRRRPRSRRRGRRARRPSRTSPSSAARNAVSVLPDPVGAATSVCRPARIAGQAATCAAVGAANVRLNQPATAGWKSCSGTMERKGAGRETRRRREKDAAPTHADRSVAPAFKTRGRRRFLRDPGRAAAPRRMSADTDPAARATAVVSLAPPARRARPGCGGAPARRRRSRSPSCARRIPRAPPGGVAARRGQAHRLLDHHEAAGQQANAADARGVGLELLLDAGGDVGVLRQELVDDRGRGRRAHQLGRLERAAQVQVVGAAAADDDARAGAVDLVVVCAAASRRGPGRRLRSARRAR